MHLGDLPPEIQNSILKLCSLADSAVLSRTHSSFRDAAEDILYSLIRICAQPCDLVLKTNDSSTLQLDEKKSPLYALVTNPRKASIVKGFYVDLSSTTRGLSYDSATDFVTENLVEALKEMKSLVDLRIIRDQTDLSERFDKVISGGFFELNSLCLEPFHDIKGIVTKQPHLELFGIYFGIGKPVADLWETFEGAFQSPSHHHRIPTFFLLHGKEGAGICMLPSLYRRGEVLRACRETATLISKWPGSHKRKCSDLSVSLFGISEDNVDLVRETMMAMVACLRDCPHDQSCESLNIRFVIDEKSVQKPWWLPDFLEPLVGFKNLSSITFHFIDVIYDYKELCLLSEDLQLCLREKDLPQRHKGIWPNLEKIWLHCETTKTNWIGIVVLVPRSSGWRITGTSPGWN